MIILRLYGGLGNQLFQLGAALLLARKSKISRLVVDTSQIVNYATSHNFVLNKLIDYDLIWENLQIEIEFDTVAITKLRIPKLITLNSKFNPFISDNNFIHAITSGKFLRIYVLDGYFQECILQSEFNEITDILAKLVRREAHDLGENTVNYDVVVHLRGTDFLTSNRNPSLNMDFYQSAVSQLSVDKPGLRILVVTDDKHYSREIFNENFNRVEFIIKSGDEIDDFMSIYKIPNRILAPSTFGLMASALGKNNIGSKVLAWPYWYDNVQRNVLVPNEVVLNRGLVK